VSDQNRQISSVLSGLKAVADLGPLGTAKRPFSEISAEVLDCVLQAVDAKTGALFFFVESPPRLQCCASAGIRSLPAETTLRLPAEQGSAWMDLEHVHPSNPEENRNFFPEQSLDLREMVRCILPLRVAESLVGAICIGGRGGSGIYNGEDLKTLDLLSHHLALIVQNHSLRESLRIQVSDNLRLLSSLNRAYDDALDAFAHTIDAVELNMSGHSTRVGRYSAAIATTLGMSESEVTGMRAAGQLHDIGKVTIDKTLSSKPGALRPEEFQMIADHTVMGHKIISSVRLPWQEIPGVVRWHHERCDGSGYPDKLQAPEVPLSARIVGVADTFDAMLNARSYRRAYTVSQAAQELVRLSPQKLDPDVVLALLSQLREQQKDSQEGPGGYAMLQIAPNEIDQLSGNLLHKLTGGRVYFA
jgi:HD-GYP domain-containing protein (c-di-GMP phosphodiesterase class II)